jgi:hypothetical protein
MPKPVIRSSAPKSASAAPAPQKATRTRESVLLKVTPEKLASLIGKDTEIGVSRKELTNLISEKSRKTALAEAGL